MHTPVENRCSYRCLIGHPHGGVLGWHFQSCGWEGSRLSLLFLVVSPSRTVHPAPTEGQKLLGASRHCSALTYFVIHSFHKYWLLVMCSLNVPWLPLPTPKIGGCFFPPPSLHSTSCSPPSECLGHDCSCSSAPPSGLMVPGVRTKAGSLSHLCVHPGARLQERPHLLDRKIPIVLFAQY